MSNECVLSDQVTLLSSELMEMRHFIVIFPFVCLFGLFEICIATSRSTRRSHEISVLVLWTFRCNFVFFFFFLFLIYVHSIPMLLVSVGLQRG